MKKHIITLGGLPGSGKSTVKRLLAESLYYKTFSTGDFVRQTAFERGMTLEAFNELVAGDKSLDLMIDARLEEIEKSEDNYIVDSHLAFHFIPSAFHVFLAISPETSARRIFNDAQSPTRIQSGDTMTTYEEALARTQKRVANHVDRYGRHYGINPYDARSYILVIDTESQTPEDIAVYIEEKFHHWIQE